MIMAIGVAKKDGSAPRAPRGGRASPSDRARRPSRHRRS